MRLKIFTSACLLFLAAHHGFCSVPRVVEYDKAVSLTGLITYEYDMAYVDGDLSPLTDPKEVARVVAEYLRKNPGADRERHVPVKHVILRLDRPVVVKTGVADGLQPAVRGVAEIDLGVDMQEALTLIRDAQQGKGHFVVTGKILHRYTVHQLRQVVMDVVEIKVLR